jgi:NADH-quinone oxidoreductase subunit M
MTIPWLTILALRRQAWAGLLRRQGRQRWRWRCHDHVRVRASSLPVQIGGGMHSGAGAVDQATQGTTLGLDGIGLTLVLLVVIITPVVIIASWRDFDAPADPSTSSGAIAPKYD